MQDPVKILLLDNLGSAKKITMAEAKKQDGLMWIRLVPGDPSAFFKKMSLNYSPVISKFLSAEETRPRMLFNDDSLLATFRGINFNQGQDPEDMVSIRLWIQKNLIVTVQHRQLISVNTIEERLLKGTGPKTSAAFLETLLELLTDKSAGTVSSITDQLDQIEELDSSQQAEQESDDVLSKLRRQIILLHRYLHPQLEAINGFSSSNLTWLGDESLHHLKEVSNLNRLILENLQAERERAKVIQEEFAALDQSLLNKKMYLIAIVTAIFMPLTFITGLFGVNLGGIPGSTASYAFVILIVILLFIGVIQIIQLKKKGWLK